MEDEVWSAGVDRDNMRYLNIISHGGDNAGAAGYQVRAHHRTFPLG